MAVKLRYKNVYVFTGGLPAWVEAGYPTDSIERLPRKEDIPSITVHELKKMIDNKEDLVLLDIRYGRLARDYYIDYSRINIPLDMLIERHQQVLDTRKKVVVIGEIGKRADVAARYLRTKGLIFVSYVKGGMKAWKEAGYPVSK